MNIVRGSTKIIVRKAVLAELPEIKRLAAANSDSLGFVLRPAIEEAIKEKRIVIAEINSELIGFQEYYHRKRDLQTTLYHKCVAPQFRRRGIGTALVDAVVDESSDMGREFLLLKCPEFLPSNLFHKSYGFTLAGVENGRRRRLNIWKLDLQLMAKRNLTGRKKNGVTTLFSGEQVFGSQ
jgi:GNAT superfamily N-acetyltransferase